MKANNFLQDKYNKREDITGDQDDELTAQRGTPFSSFTFMDLKDNGIYHFSHSPPRSPASCKRKILKLTKKSYLYQKLR